MCQKIIYMFAPPYIHLMNENNSEWYIFLSKYNTLTIVYVVPVLCIKSFWTSWNSRLFCSRVTTATFSFCAIVVHVGGCSKDDPEKEFFFIILWFTISCHKSYVFQVILEKQFFLMAFTFLNENITHNQIYIYLSIMMTIVHIHLFTNHQFCFFW